MIGAMRMIRRAHSLAACAILVIPSHIRAPKRRTRGLNHLKCAPTLPRRTSSNSGAAWYGRGNPCGPVTKPRPHGDNDCLVCWKNMAGTCCATFSHTSHISPRVKGGVVGILYWSCTGLMGREGCAYSSLRLGSLADGLYFPFFGRFFEAVVARPGRMAKTVRRLVVW